MRYGPLLILAALSAPVAWCAGLPADASVSHGKTMEPKVVVDSGHLEWTPYKHDLTRWLTLSYQDRRPTPEPASFNMKEPLAGDAARGKKLAWEWCNVCHALPGDEWPGTVGSPMAHYKQFKHPDALVFQQIYDARIFNPQTVMPAFGTFGLLAEQDIRDLVAYLQSIE
jgi:sulfur oxidation c-type cytochrome SoxX